MKIIIHTAVIIFSFLLLECNPMYEKNASPTLDSLHPSLPFSSTVYHGYYYRFPNGSCNESQCHGNSLGGGNTGAPSCYSCHGDRWTIYSTTHTLVVKNYYHHTAVDTDTSTTDTGLWYNSCKDSSCHGSDLTGVTSNGYSCFACHDPIPPPGHRKYQEGAAHHFNLEEENPSTYCSGSACHGASGENGSRPCADCHD